MDIYTSQSMQFIEQNADKPFFVYLATNTPHGPLQIEESQYKHHIDNGLPENVAKVYGMIENMKFELFDMKNDPGEKRDIAAQFPEIAQQMKKDYEKWFAGVSSRGYDPPRMYIGSAHENPVRLTQQDWRGSKSWGDEDLGYWEVSVVSNGVYAVNIILSKPADEDLKTFFQSGEIRRERIIKKGDNSVTIENIPINIGEKRFEAWIIKKQKKMGVRFLDVYKRS